MFINSITTIQGYFLKIVHVLGLGNKETIWCVSNVLIHYSKKYILKQEDFETKFWGIFTALSDSNWFPGPDM